MYEPTLANKYLLQLLTKAKAKLELEGERGRSGLVSFKTWHITNKDSLTGAEEERGAGWWALKHGTSQMRTHLLEGRKREEWVGELGNMAHQRGLTHWRGERSVFMSLKMQHMANENSLAQKEEEGGAGWWARKHGTLQMSTHFLEGRKRVGELRNVACCKMGTHLLEGRKRDKWVYQEKIFLP